MLESETDEEEEEEEGEEYDEEEEGEALETKPVDFWALYSEFYEGFVPVSITGIHSLLCTVCGRIFSFTYRVILIDFPLRPHPFRLCADCFQLRQSLNALIYFV